MRKPFTPREYQTLAVDHLLCVPRCALWAGMGMGKTTTALSTLDILELTDPGPTLVLAPKRVATSTWPDEAVKWDHLRNVEVSPVIGTPAERRAALKKPANVFTINYENLPWLVEECGSKWPFRKVIADESTRLKNFRTKQGGLRSRALGQVAHSKVERFIELTGTPSPNGLMDLWGQAWFLDRGQRLGSSYSSFENRWFGYRRIQDAVSGDWTIKPVIFPFAQQQIQDRMRDLCLTLDPRDWFVIDEPIVNVIRVELPGKARRMYREMEREMFLALDNGREVEAVNAASKTIKCLQLANGAIYDDEKCATFQEVHDAKLQALESVIEESAGMPVLVAYHFKSDLARLLRAFPQGRALDDSPDTIRAWNSGGIPVLFAHPASAGHGLNLQDGGNILVFFGHWWDLEQFQQIIERIGPVRQAQAGHERPVFIHHIVAAGTVDEIVMSRRESKRGVQDLLLEAMKRR